MSRSGIFETVVGAVVIAVAAVFLTYAYSVSGKQVSAGAYNLNAIFGRVDGITVGSEVRIAGVKVGTVSGFALDTNTYEAKLDLQITGGVPVPEDSIAKIVSDGLLGGAHVSIEPGASDIMLAANEAITITQGSVDLLGIAMQAFSDNAAGKGSGGADKPADDTSGGL
ncbi:MAG TPA: MlaD family protein [Parvularculaceae bacterium]|nr:MCE family protein [Caulobacterales bacterium]HOP18996.1 MlaD family protein [Amphiplicatus sp.]HPE30793.1 MlaD family protein [Parvularculaceae bacterium]HRX38441.1 MlaD family protein [Parvularculaceae bacterium]